MECEAVNIIKHVLTAFYEKRDVTGFSEYFCRDIAFYGSFSETSSEGCQEVIDELHKEIQLFPMAQRIINMDMHIMNLKEDLVSVCVSYDVENGADQKPLSYHLSSISVLEEGRWKLKMLHNSFSDSEQKEMMRRMQQTVSRYHEAIADTDLSIWYYDMKKKCIMQDGNSYEIHGFDHVIENVPESLIACGYVHPDDAESFRHMYDRMFAGEPLVSGDFWVRQSESNAYWCERITYKVVYDENNIPVMALGSSKDVSLEKDAERKYKEEISYKMALQQNGLGSYMLNLKRNEIVSVNERAGIFSLAQDTHTVDDFFEKCLRFNDIIMDDVDIESIFDREKLLGGFRDADKTFQFETEYCNDKKQTIWLQWTLRILKNPQTEELTAFLYIEDVTQTRILSEMIETVIEHDYDYVEAADLATQEVIRIVDSEMIRARYGHTGHDTFLDPDTAWKHLSLDYVEKQLETQDMYEYVCECIGESGEIRYKHWRYWYLSKERRKVIFVKSDITAITEEHNRQKQLLEDALKHEESASNAKGTFLSNMSHEIRTPLNAIIGYLSIAQDQDCSPEKKDYCIGNCETASKHLLHIINDVLDMSSIESGKLKIAHEEFDLKKEITDITSIFYQNAKMKDVHMETHIEDVTEEWVVGDQLRLNQILMNLLSNAVKFTPEDGHIYLKVHQLRKDDRQVFMKFTVKDTGIGMSKEYMSRIFHPFEQENAGTAKKFGGSGLGLSITSSLVQMMGGKIEVQSEQGKGTAFEVTMFFDLTENHHDSFSQVPADYSRVRVLVVDDQDDECSYIKMMLKRCGVKADTVTSGTKALRKIQSRKGGDYSYDLCIIDWNMPELNGCEVTRKIRMELGEEMPIIIATAYDISEFEEEAKAAGANKIVAKPLFQSTLFDLLVSSFGQYDPAAHMSGDLKIDLTGIHVLLAEDNVMNMDIAVTILEKAGVKVDQAKDGKEAVDLFLASKEKTYDLVLMDVQMPVMDGYEATTVIRTSGHPEAKTIPIIAMTANAFAEDVAEALAKGMNAHIAKPVSYDKLFAVLKEFSNKDS